MPKILKWNENVHNVPCQTYQAQSLIAQYHLVTHPVLTQGNNTKVKSKIIENCYPQFSEYVQQKRDMSILK